VIQIRRSCHALSRDLCHTRVSFQETTHIIAVAPVPFRPALPRRERSDLIEASCVPRLCDELDIAENGVKCKASKERWLVHRRTVLVTPEDGSKVKTKTVYAVFDNPVAQAI